MSCKQRTVIDSVMGGGNSMAQDTTGEFEYLKTGDTVMWRLESKSIKVDKTPSGERKHEFPTSVNFDDGTHRWMLLGSGGEQVAWKLKTREKMRDSQGALDPHFENEHPVADKAFIDTLRAGHVLTVGAEVTVDGKACYVVEALPEMFKGRMGPGKGVTHYYIQQETGLVVKIVTNDTEGRPMTTMTRTDIKINPSISPDRFKPPLGVPVKEQ